MHFFSEQLCASEAYASVLLPLLDGISITGNLAHDVATFLIHHGQPHTANHSTQVAAEARRVALLVGGNAEAAEAAGWLHDCSEIFPTDERVTIARKLGLPVLPEENAFPMIVHQKLSRVLASSIFGVADKGILSAIECHTTLKGDASQLDKIVFVADKIAWDQEGTPPYLDDLLIALEKSLDEAVMVYLTYLWERRSTLRVVHPWFKEAYLQLSQSYHTT